MIDLTAHSSRLQSVWLTHIGQPPACKQSLTITTGVTWCAVPLLLVVRADHFPLCNMTFCCTHFCARTFVQHPALSEGFCPSLLQAWMVWLKSNGTCRTLPARDEARCPRLQETLLLALPAQLSSGFWCSQNNKASLACWLTWELTLRSSSKLSRFKFVLPTAFQLGVVHGAWLTFSILHFTGAMHLVLGWLLWQTPKWSTHPKQCASWTVQRFCCPVWCMLRQTVQQCRNMHFVHNNYKSHTWQLTATTNIIQTLWMT